MTGQARRPGRALPAALLLLAVLLAAQFVLHPHTPYKLFVLRAAPAVALWLAVGIAAPRRRMDVAFAALVSLGAVTAWGPMHLAAFLPPLAAGWIAPVLIAIGLAVLLVLAACRGAFNDWYTHGPMTALGAALVIYALASGFVALPFGPAMMTAGMVWIALWQGIYLYRLRDA